MKARKRSPGIEWSMCRCDTVYDHGMFLKCFRCGFMFKRWERPLDKMLRAATIRCASGAGRAGQS